MQKSKLQLKNKNFLKGWEASRLKDVISEIISGDWGKGENGDEFVMCRVLRGTDFRMAQKGLFRDVPCRFIKKKSFEKLKLKPGDILIELSGGSKDQPTGRVFIWREDFNTNNENIIFSNFVKKFKLNTNKVKPEFFYRYWQLLYLSGKTTTYEKRTTGIRNFKYKDFIENEKIPLLSLPIQQKIVGVLDTVREAVKAQEKIIGLAKELKKSLMAKLFREGNRGAKLKKTEIGKIPENWEVVEIKKIGRVVTGSTPSTSVNEYWNGNVPFVTPSDFNKERYVLKTERTITEKGEKQVKIIPQNSVMVVCIGSTIGKISLSSQICVTNQQINSVICNELADPIFVYYTLFLKKELLRNYAGTTAKPILKKSLFEQIKIPLPSLPEQREIAEILQTVDQKIEIEQKKKALYEDLFKTMLNKLMNREIEVEKLNL